MNFKAISYIVLFLSLLNGCELPNVPTEDTNKISIVGMLASDNVGNTNKIKIFKSWFYNEVLPNETFVDDATGYIYTMDDQAYEIKLDSVHLADSEWQKFYSNQELQIIPGQRYSLSITTPLGMATGETVVPGRFHITNPIDEQEVEIIKQPHEVLVTWDKSEHAYFYVVEVKSTAIDTIHNVEVPLADNIFSFNEKANLYLYKSVIPGGILKDVTIQVRAYDKNFHDHRYLETSSSGLSNAYGFLGSNTVSNSIKLKVKYK